MQKEKLIDCPFEVWLNAKICLPTQERGFALAKLSDAGNGLDTLILTLDAAYLGTDNIEPKVWNKVQASAIKNLQELPQGTTLLLAPPKLFGSKFWIVKLGELVDHNQQQAYYTLLQVKPLSNFREARSSDRIPFNTPVYLVDGDTGALTEYYTRDISSNGLGLIIDPHSQVTDVFEVGGQYTFQLKIHEVVDLPDLTYRCVHKREDLVSGAKVIGFSLNDDKASDPDVQYTLTLLTWTDNGASTHTTEGVADD